MSYFVKILTIFQAGNAPRSVHYAASYWVWIKDISNQKLTFLMQTYPRFSRSLSLEMNLKQQ